MFGTILVPADGLVLSGRAIHAAMEFAKDTAARLAVLADRLADRIRSPCYPRPFFRRVPPVCGISAAALVPDAGKDGHPRDGHSLSNQGGCDANDQMVRRDVARREGHG